MGAALQFMLVWHLENKPNFSAAAWLKFIVKPPYLTQHSKYKVLYSQALTHMCLPMTVGRQSCISSHLCPVGQQMHTFVALMLDALLRQGRAWHGKTQLNAAHNIVLGLVSD